MSLMKLMPTLVAAIGSIPMLREIWNAREESAVELPDDEDVSVFTEPPSFRTRLCPMVVQHARPRS